jgi:MFS family permease
LRALSPPASREAEGGRLLVPVLGFCLLVSTAAYLMVFTMLGQIGAALHASATLANWIVIATIITATVSAALFPGLGSALGQRRLMVAAMACLAVGSLVSAAAPDAATLLVGRVIAAPGFAASSLSVAIVREHVSVARLPRAFGVIAAYAGAAAGVGFTLGGLVEEAVRSDWHSVFLAMAAVSVITGVLAAVAIPGGKQPSRRADLAGGLLLAGGLVVALLPITEGAAWGWTSWRVIGLFAGALVLLAAWLITELRRADPLVRLGALRLPGVAGGTLLFLVTAATVGVVNLTVPAFLEAPVAVGYGTGASVLNAGLDLLPFALAIAAAGVLAGRLARWIPARVIAVVTLACEALALLLLAGFHHGGDQVVILAAVFGLGHGGTIAVEYVLLTGAVPPTVVGGVTGVASAVDGVSGAVASAVTTGLLAVGLVRAHGMSLPSAADYSRAWLVGAAVAASGALAVAVSAVRMRHLRQGSCVSSPGPVSSRELHWLYARKPISPGRTRRTARIPGKGTCVSRCPGIRPHGGRRRSHRGHR